MKLVRHGLAITRHQDRELIHVPCDFQLTNIGVEKLTNEIEKLKEEILSFKS